jgi:peptidoglycan/LPS O-acetylase OafA/YrhL
MNLFTNTLFTEGVLPFLLVFVLVFAILQKSKILGDGKKQIDALVALAIGLILVGSSGPRNFIVNMMPWLAVALVVLLIFFLVYGFAASDKTNGLVIPDWVKNTILILAIIFVIVLVLVITDTWGKLWNWLAGDSMGGTVVMILVVVAALWATLGTGGSSSGGNK